MPVDVEVLGVVAAVAVAEEVPPPAVLLAGYRHVVGHDVQDLAELVFPQRPAETSVSLGAAQLAVHAGVVDHVVAVAGARLGLQIGRAVGVAHTQRRQVGRDGRGGVEVEAPVKLEAVGGARGDPSSHLAVPVISGALATAYS